jgi:hypothetical protein
MDFAIDKPLHAGAEAGHQNNHYKQEGKYVANLPQQPKPN